MSHKVITKSFLLIIMGSIWICHCDRTKADIPQTAQSSSDLSRHVSINEVPISLKTLCIKLSDRHLKLLPGKEYRGQQLQIDIKNKTVQQIMDALCKLLSGQWESATNSSMLILKMKPEAFEERKKWLQLYTEIYQSATDNFYKNTTQGIKTGFLEKNAKFKVDNSGSNVPPAIMEAYFKNALNLQFYYALPVSTLNRIAHLTDLISYMAPDGIEGVTQKREPVLLQFNELPESDQQLEKANIENLYKTAKDQTLFSSNPIVEVFLNGPNLFLSELLKNDTTLVFDGPKILVNSTQSNYDLMFVNPYSSYTDTLPFNNVATETYKELGSFPSQFFHQNAPISTGQSKNATSDLPTRRVDKLEWIAHTTGMQYLSDYYDEPASPLLAQNRMNTLPEPLPIELDSLSLKNHSSWHKEKNGIVLVRDNQWYRDDHFQPNLKVIGDMWQMVHETEHEISGANSLEQVHQLRKKLQIDLEEYAYHNLSTMQLVCGLRYYVLEPKSDGYDPPNPAYPFRPFGRIAEDIFHDINILKLYQLLTSSERKIFLSGKLNVLTLSPAQQKQAIKCSPALYYVIRNPVTNHAVLIHLKAGLQLNSASNLVNPGYTRLEHSGVISDYSFKVIES